MNDTGTLSFEILKEITGYERPGDVERCLREQGIVFLRGKGGKPFTTLAALNQAIGINHTTKRKLDPKYHIEF